jgi:hypothetical protein
MSIKKLFFPLFVVFVIGFLSCYYDNEETLYPVLNSACDTSAVTFSASIAPILSASCLSCHSNATAASFGSNIRLEAYADVKTNITALTGSIKQTVSYSPMPKNGGKLNACSILKFDIWVRQGMLNN